MDINAMIIKRVKLSEKITRLQSRIEKDSVSLVKAQTELDRLNASLAQSAELMASMLDLDPDMVRDKLLQQAGSLDSLDSLEAEKIDDDAGETIESKDVEKDSTSENASNSCGLKINPFESIV